MARQRLIRGDARIEVPKLADGSFEVLITDPPYGLPMWHEGTFDWHLHDEDMDATMQLTTWLMHEAARVLSDDGFLYLTAGDSILAEAMLAGRAAGFKMRSFAWVKSSAPPNFPGHPYRNAINPCLFGYRRLGRRRYRGGALNWLNAMPEQGARRRHPTQKPLALFEYWLKQTPGRVLDPFAGSGTTLVAAKRLGLEALGIEVNKEYVAWARERLMAARPGAGR